MSAFDRLHPNLRHAIVHDLGWRVLRPVQELAIEAILDGANAVVLAPTAGGKTEAAMFPLLSRILSEGLRPVSALYICPIRALLNNQEQRLKAYARMVGLDAFKWHGDVAQSEKRRFREFPAHILMTTPESLEAMLMNRPDETAGLFAALSMVVVDEIHAFAEDDRGAHLVAILERLTRFCGRDLQRIGLSATVGNPQEIGPWLAGSSRRSFRLVDPERPAVPRDLSVDIVEDDGGIIRRVLEIGLGRKSLVFAETRSGVESIAAALQGHGVDTFVHHGSVSREDRERAEARFERGSNTAIVCTRTLELGIDVGDLDHVIQINAPRTVSAILQRMGRTGRRAGTVANCHFLCENEEQALQASGMLRLLTRGWVEDVRPDDRAAHVLAHQILALSMQELGVGRSDVLPWVAGAACFAGLGQEAVDNLVTTMLAREILYESEGRLTLGKEGERLYAGKNFLELYAVFATPPVLTVKHGRMEIGTLDAPFMRSQEDGKGPGVFRLAGRPWQVTEIDWRRAICFVEPADAAKPPKWGGGGGFLSYEICQSIKAVLAEDVLYPWLRPSAAMDLRALRLGYRDVVQAGTAAIELNSTGATWHTFAGGAANAAFVAALARRGADWTCGNLDISTKDPLAAAAAVADIAALGERDLEADARDAAAMRIPKGLSKFQPCLPRDVELDLAVRRRFDPERARQVWATERRIVVQSDGDARS